jgi:ubiquinol-cytochrome c reductase cytochrome b subunit
MFIVVTFFYPNFLGHSDNYITANPLVTPAHIVPEWYFLPFYAILRAVPNKLGGVVAMLASILILIVLPFIRNRKSVFVKSSRFNPKRKIFFFLFSIVFILLGYIGGNVAEEPFITAGRILSTLYFLLLLSLEGGVLQVFLSQKKL